ncbi:hypothetical protein FHS43_006048 [Streptosporangium becharense]|uniref:Uncharacterized protein n=1 Tax=Streptosporangium becharense TaxID=1816182 RepID=A0A7W9IHM6_9ACTN|nr:hypothetical protein [Streptosporangium becharense]MBB2914736.1 hypothetical protein [Streptosporangium becharense]MBB5820863.1 hypothetical protein [Streptosporangium becharense]
MTTRPHTGPTHRETAPVRQIVLRTAALTLIPVVLAATGLLHPHHLTPETAERWVTLHLLLLPVFPLLAGSLLLLLRGVRGPWAVVARVGSYVYAIFYTSLDAIAGIAYGTLVANTDDPTTLTRAGAAIDVVGGALGLIGAVGFLLASIATTAALAARHGGRRVAAGGTILIAASVVWLGSHIYWPEGVITALALGLGIGLLNVATSTGTAPAPGDPGPRPSALPA